MAQLFSNWTIKSSTEVIWWYNQEYSLSIIQKLYEDFKKGLMKDETAYEQTFNQLFFVELLGYLPNENLRPKAWTPIGGKIADAALGFFPEGVYIAEWVQVAVELKGCGVQLDKRQNRQDTQTPVEQGFGYKTSFSSCKWLIVSNFFVTRLYRDNKQDYEERTLEQLMDPLNNYFQLKKLILLLHQSRLLQLGWTDSHTEKLLSQFRIQQENITKKFYKEYKELRLALINDIRHNNPNVSVEVSIEKAQKIIDRIVFIHFCEDRWLLPSDKLKENVYRAAEADFTPWEVLKKFFTAVDAGSQKLGIPEGYNGELFKPDNILDVLRVWDAICNKFIALWNYDFNEELSVNILGHIFEQSISDIEQLKIELIGQETETDQLVEKKESKRKKDGIFYTPEYIVDYIVENSLMKYLAEKEDECLARIGKRGWYKTDLEAYQAYQHILQNIKVVDPACGSGAFLVKVFDRLYAENERVGKIVGGLFDETSTYKNILTNNIYGVDLNPESVEITKLSLRLKSAQKGKKLNNLNKNIKCGNSLIDESSVSWDKAFLWEKIFFEVFEKGGFNVIVGNPPYVVIGNFDQQSNMFLKNKYKSADGKFDLYYLFIELTTRILNKDGVFGMILPNKFFHTKSAKNLRVLLQDYKYIKHIVDFTDHQIFNWATTYTCILFLTKYESSTILYTKADRELNVLSTFNVQTSDLTPDMRSFANTKIVGIMQKINKCSIQLQTIVDRFWTWMQSWADSILIVKQGVIFEKNIEAGVLQKILRWRDVRRYHNWEGWQIIFPYDDFFKPLKQDVFKLKYPNTFNYLNTQKEELAWRIWFWKTATQLSWQRYWMVYVDQKENFEKKMILSPCLSNMPNFSLSTWDLFTNGTAGVVSIIPKTDSGFDIYFLLAYLNTSLINFVIKQISPIFSGWYYKYSAPYLKKLPIPNKKIDQIWFIEKAKIMLSLKDVLYWLKATFLNRVKNNITDKTTWNLDNFEYLSFKEFIAELKKQKINLTFDQQDEREPYFNDYKSRVLENKQKIQQTDTEIDTMVFDLYGLTEEERKIILDSI